MTTLIECSIDFFSENDVAVSVNSGNEYSIDFLALFLFNSYTFRQALNIGTTHPVVVALGKTLAEIPVTPPNHFAVVPTNAPIFGKSSNLRYVSIEDINFVPPGKLGNKRFFSRLITENGITNFILEPKGFGLLGEGINYYAPTSVFVLLYFLMKQRIDLRRLSIGATVCGKAIGSGILTLENQLEYAYKFTENVLRAE